MGYSMLDYLFYKEVIQAPECEGWKNAEFGFLKQLYDILEDRIVGFTKAKR